MQYIKHEKGFSLIQVMVAMAVVSILAVVLMQIMEKSNIQQKTVQVNAEITSLESTIRSILQSDASCSVNFSDKQISVGDELATTMSGLTMSQSSTDAVSFNQNISNLVNISSVKVKEISDLVNGRGRVVLEFTFKKEINTSGKRTTQGPEEVKRTVDFFALFCRSTKWGPGGDSDGDGYPDFPCGNSLGEAKSVCDLSCEGQTVDGVTISAGCYCDDHKDFVSGVAGADGQTCYSFQVLDECSSTQPIARCDNQG